MNVIQTELEGVLIIEPVIFPDSRGYFYEPYNVKKYHDAGIKDNFVQDNQSLSVKGVVRGIHLQLWDNAQSKLVRAIRGRVIDVAVDLRIGSKTFGKSVSIELSEVNHKQLYIPRGFGHGFCVLSPVAEFFYKCDNYYEPSAEAGVIYNDPDLNIDWGLPLDSLSPSLKDNNLPSLAEYIALNTPK